MMVCRTAREDDVEAIVATHLKAFPGFFLTLMGPGFLRELYRGFLRHADGVLLVSVDEQERLTGFVAGTLAPDRFFAELRRRRGVYFLLRALPALLVRPALVFAKLWSALFYRGDKPALLQGGALLSSIGVLPEVVGRSVGKELLAGFEREAFARGAAFVYLTTDADGNNLVQAFYGRNGYAVESEFIQGGGRAMLRYVKHADLN